MRACIVTMLGWILMQPSRGIVSIVDRLTQGETDVVREQLQHAGSRSLARAFQLLNRYIEQLPNFTPELPQGMHNM